MLLVDDWIETGSQARSVSRLARRLGAVFVGVAVLVDDTSDAVRAELDVHALLPRRAAAARALSRSARPSGVGHRGGRNASSSAMRG